MFPPQCGICFVLWTRDACDGSTAGDSRPVSPSGPPRGRRHGGGPPRPGSAGRPGGHQGAPSQHHRERQRPPPPGPRGRDHAPGPQRVRRGGAGRRRGRRVPLHRHPVRARPDAGGHGAQPRAAVRLGPAPAGLRHRGGADRDPRRGRGAPRPQAGQRDAHRRPPGGDRLRHRPVPGRHPADPDRPGHGDARVPGSRGDRGPAEQPGLRRALLGRDDGVRGHRARALRRGRRLVPDDLLPHRLRSRRPVRRPRAARAAAVRGPGPGPVPPPVGRLAERPGQRPGPGRGRPGGHRAGPPPGRRDHEPRRTAGKPAIEKPDKRGKKAKNQRPQAYPAPKQAARDVADLLPPVGYAPLPPFPPPGQPQAPQASPQPPLARPAAASRRTQPGQHPRAPKPPEEARKAPARRNPRTRTPVPPRSPAGPPWPAWPS